MLNKSFNFFNGTVNLSESKTDDRKKKYPCYICLSKFCSTSDLSYHKALCHTDDANDIENASRDSENDSDYCDEESDDLVTDSDDSMEDDSDIKNSDNPTTLPINPPDPTSNINKAVPITPFQCKTCNVVFNTLQELRSHKSLTAKCVFSCKLCSRLFNTSNGFLVHFVYHRYSFELLKFFNCEKCNAVFGNYFQLKKHEIICHTIKSEPSEFTPLNKSDINTENTLASHGQLVPKVEPQDADYSGFNCELCFDICHSEEDFIEHMKLHKQLELEDDDVIIIDDDDTHTSSCENIAATSKDTNTSSVCSSASAKSRSYPDGSVRKGNKKTIKSEAKSIVNNVHILPKPAVTKPPPTHPSIPTNFVPVQNDNKQIVVPAYIKSLNSYRTVTVDKPKGPKDSDSTKKVPKVPPPKIKNILPKRSVNENSHQSNMSKILTNQSVSSLNTTEAKTLVSSNTQQVPPISSVLMKDPKNNGIFISVQNLQQGVSVSENKGNPLKCKENTQQISSILNIQNLQHRSTNANILLNTTEKSVSQVPSLSNIVTTDPKGNTGVIIGNIQNLPSTSHSFITASSANQSMGTISSNWTSPNLVANPNLVYVMNPINSTPILSAIPTEPQPTYVSDSSNIAYFIMPTNNAADNVTNANFVGQRSQAAKMNMTFSEGSQYLGQVNQLSTFSVSEQNNMVCSLPQPMNLLAHKNTPQFPGNISMPVLSNTSDNNYYLIANQSNKTVITQNTLVKILPKPGL